LFDAIGSLSFCLQRVKSQKIVAVQNKLLTTFHKSDVHQKHNDGERKDNYHGAGNAYEVDGFGNSNLMDDANVLNLLSIPYLGYSDYDPKICQKNSSVYFFLQQPNVYKGTQRLDW
jgi:meiotically up-regulated gene 157 (Mug157) protein